MPAYDGNSVKSGWTKGPRSGESRTLRWSDYVPAGRACFTVTRHVGPGEPAPLHQHDFHEIFWIRRGRGLHTVNGQAHALAPGSFALVRDTDEHALTAGDGNGFVITNVAFTRETWRHIVERYFDGQDMMDADSDERHHHLGMSAARQAESFATHALAGADDRFTAERLLLDILALLRARPRASTPGTAPAWLNRVLLGLEDPVVLREGVQGLARLSGRSPEHLAREIRRVLNKRPTDLLNEARMQRAAAGLLHSLDSVDEIARGCGLDNLSHFYKLFREAYGCSPNRFRRRGHELVTANGSTGRQGTASASTKTPG